MFVYIFDDGNIETNKSIIVQPFHFLLFVCFSCTHGKVNLLKRWFDKCDKCSNTENMATKCAAKSPSAMIIGKFTSWLCVDLCWHPCSEKNRDPGVKMVHGTWWVFFSIIGLLSMRDLFGFPLLWDKYWDGSSHRFGSCCKKARTQASALPSHPPTYVNRCLMQYTHTHTQMLTHRVISVYALTPHFTGLSSEIHLH